MSVMCMPSTISLAITVNELAGSSVRYIAIKFSYIYSYSYYLHYSVPIVILPVVMYNKCKPSDTLPLGTREESQVLMKIHWGSLNHAVEDFLVPHSSRAA